MITRKTLAVLILTMLSGFSSPLPAQEPTPAAEPAETPADPAEAAASVEEEKSLYPTRNARDQALFAKSSAEEVRWLETPSSQQLALYRPTEDRRTLGALLILQGQMEPPGWHPLLENPRRTLPRHAWATLAMNLPALVPPSPPPRPQNQAVVDPATSTAPAGDPVAVPPTEPAPPIEPSPPAEEVLPGPTREELINQSLNAALDWLAAENLSPVILMLDASLATEVMAQLRTRTQGLPSALVMINLQNHQAFTTAELEALFANPALPVLDVFVTAGAAHLVDARQRHKAVALRQQLANYRQMEVPEMSPLSLNDHRTDWVEKLRGFMALKK